MPTNSDQWQPAEFAHVLMMDVAGYSRFSAEEQARAVRELNRLVRETAEFRRAEADGEVIPLPTGDGMALVFFRYPLAPIRCAVELRALLAGRTDLPLRMGIHSGPVSRHTDIAGRVNVTGGGINQSQRVMD